MSGTAVVYRRQPGQVREGVDLPRDPLAPENSTAAHPVRHRSRGAVRAGSEIRHQTEDWEYGASFLYDFVAPLTWHVRDLRSTPRALDQAGHQPRRRSPLPVRRSLDGRHSLSGVDLLELRAHPGTGDPRHGPRGLPGARPHDAHHRVWRELARSGRTTSRPSTKTGASPRQGDGQELACAAARTSAPHRTSRTRRRSGLSRPAECVAAFGDASRGQPPA